MLALSSISVSGMNAARSVLGSSAHNLANLSTAGFRREEVTRVANADGGVSATLSQASREGNALETDAVSLLVAKNQFLANLAVFRTDDQLIGSVLDVVG